MRVVYLDTVGLIALWDQHDQWHAAAEQAFARLNLTPFITVTSPFVLLECANAASRRPYRKHLVDLRTALLAQNLVIAPTDDEIAAAWADYESKRLGSASVVDITSFAIMRRLDISDAFTNDAHFRVAGFTTLF